MLVDSAGIDHVSYLLVLYSLAFLLYLCKPSKPPAAQFWLSNSSQLQWS